MSSGARDRTCVEGALLSALQGYGRPDRAFCAKNDKKKCQDNAFSTFTHRGPGIHTTLETIDLAGETSDEAHET
jgi:hypothetical protein